MDTVTEGPTWCSHCGCNVDKRCCCSKDCQEPHGDTPVLADHYDRKRDLLP